MGLINSLILAATLDWLPRIPFGDYVEAFVDWLIDNAAGLIGVVRSLIEVMLDTWLWVFGLIPAVLFILLITAFAFWISKKKNSYGLPIFVFIGLIFIASIDYWEYLIETLALVVTAGIISVVIGVPLGILMSKSNLMQSIITPILDFMQTMPAFVYLIPAVAFFSIGMVPGVVASVIFAMPPTVRFANLGIRQVPTEIIEASDSFGSTPWQKLFKVQLPMAKVTIMAGINQTIMLALSMVVIAAMIGADGLGREVYYAVGRNDISQGFEAGIAIVILAIILDRLTQSVNK
ncbi:ABC transporter permease [Texcoconibacillus texcoconensis]|uniref:Glycine betaine/proline transport system permease protein n=1 Tax=Texcoconibacillus texcoconensis TaxID=1095777 RepID=A0A840QRX4_9BACI|nr:proline/glycine betaine ABC transporter permease [Texcoconibacillus texcoconensis]MBB5174242.1 glycine betaine/proline transport system permease protein [Texcoconibacillus texcoconensis]